MFPFHCFCGCLWPGKPETAVHMPERTIINCTEWPENCQFRFPSLPVRGARMREPRRNFTSLCGRPNTAEAGGGGVPTALMPELTGRDVRRRLGPLLWQILDGRFQ